MKIFILIITLTSNLYFYSQDNNDIKIELLKFSDKSYNDYSVTPYNDGIYFISDRLNNKQKLFYTDFKNSPVRIKLQSKYHIGPICLDKNNDVYLTLSGAKSYIENISSYKKIKKTPLTIYKGKIENNKIIHLKELSLCKGNYDYGHPHILNNLMIISSRKRKQFSLIIYENINDKWNIQNVVIKENNPLVFPFFKDKNTIIFSSNRKGGLGDLDLYKIEKHNGIWSDPINLKEFNTEFDDFSLVYTSEYEGYFSSNRYYKDHIFKFTINH